MEYFQYVVGQHLDIAKLRQAHLLEYWSMKIIRRMNDKVGHNLSWKPIAQSRIPASLVCLLSQLWLELSAWVLQPRI